jgi:hypothetical protein
MVPDLTHPVPPPAPPFVWFPIPLPEFSWSSLVLPLPTLLMADSMLQLTVQQPPSTFPKSVPSTPPSTTRQHERRLLASRQRGGSQAYRQKSSLMRYILAVWSWSCPSTSPCLLSSKRDPSSPSQAPSPPALPLEGTMNEALADQISVEHTPLFPPERCRGLFRQPVTSA